jgi:hypothetical protein
MARFDNVEWRLHAPGADDAHIVPAVFTGQLAAEVFDKCSCSPAAAQHDDARPIAPLHMNGLGGGPAPGGCMDGKTSLSHACCHLHTQLCVCTHVPKLIQL